MADIRRTIERYSQICKEDKGPSSDFIAKVLAKESELHSKDGSRVKMHMYLAGNNIHLTKIRLNNNDALLLYKTLHNNTFVTSIDLRYNSISDEGAKHIAKLIEETPSLKAINLMHNDFGQAGAMAISHALSRNETLKSLRLNGNKIGIRGGMYFAQLLQINRTLEAIDLADTDQKTESIIALAAILISNKTLRAMNVSRPILFTLQEEPTVHFATALKVNVALEELHMAKFGMVDDGVSELAEKLAFNKTLKHLDLSCNKITRDGAEALSKLLMQNTPLELLDLGYNRIEDDGAEHIAHVLAKYNTNLKTLVIVSNNVNGRGICALAQAMKLNSTLVNLYIWGNKLEESACLAMADLLETQRILPENTDVRQYVVDHITRLAQLSNGVNQTYYWGPSFGDNAIPDIAQFTTPVGRIDKSIAV